MGPKWQHLAWVARGSHFGDLMEFPRRRSRLGNVILWANAFLDEVERAAQPHETKESMTSAQEQWADIAC